MSRFISFHVLCARHHFCYLSSRSKWKWCRNQGSAWIVHTFWYCCHVLLIGSCTSEWIFLRYCQSTASTVFFFLLHLHPLPSMLPHTHFPVGSVTYQSCHDSAAVRAARTDEEQPQEKNESEHHICLNDLLHPHTPHWLQNSGATARIGLSCTAVCAHTRTQNLFLDTWPNIGPYWGELQSPVCVLAAA